jgi:hypothetical protein
MGSSGKTRHRETGTGSKLSISKADSRDLRRVDKGRHFFAMAGMAGTG